MIRRVGVAAIALSMAVCAHATTRVELQSARVAPGQPAVLVITTDALRPPDYGPLRAGFVINDVAVERSLNMGNGDVSLQQRYMVTLTPRGSGTVVVPSLTVGNDRTQPLALDVDAGAATPSAPMQPAASGRGPVFVQATVDDARPYVQQSVGMTVRLYYAAQLVSGTLDVPPPDGASLVQVGEDSRSMQQIDGRTYGVIERHYQVVPERSGAITLPAPRFVGAGEGGLFDQVFGDGREDLHASGQPVLLHVRPIPANASQPWLPLHALSIRLIEPPVKAVAGGTVMLTVHADADGAIAAQLPELTLEAGAGAQVFPDAAQVRDEDANGRPRTSVTRQFAIVPGQAGILRVRVHPVGWWNVDANRAETTSAPELDIAVAPGAAFPVGPGPGTATADARSAGHARSWRWLAVMLGCGAPLLLLLMAWHGRRIRVKQGASPRVSASLATGIDPGPKISLRDALASGDLAGIAAALQRDAGADGLDAVRARLADADQAQAVADLQRALWASGDRNAALARLCIVFRSGASLRPKASFSNAATELPPLYPER